MKNAKDALTLKILAGGLASSMLWFVGPAGHLAAQTPAAEETPAALADGDSATDQTTITLRQFVVTVYEFEDMKVAVDEYQVKRGDSLVKLLRQRGLLNSRSRAEEAKLLRLVKSLNPDLKDPSAIVPGQTLKLPARLGETPGAAGGNFETQAKAEVPASPGPDSSTEMVKVYERPQSTQQAARVVVMRHQPGMAGPEGRPQPAEALEADQDLKKASSPDDQPQAAAADAADAGSPGTGQAGQVQATSAVLNFPSGNAGPLAMEPDSKVVYRTVEIRRGDSLERLLRREGMHRDVIYSHLLKITMELNPEIKNPDLILAGAEIKIPAAGDYLTALAGLDPQEVKTAALAISERRRPDGGGAGRRGGRAAVLELPDEAVLTAKNTLGLIFTRLGAQVDSRGTVLIPAGEGGVELNTASFPLVELNSGGRLVLDPGSRLSPAALRNLRRLQPPYQVFRTGKNETLERALGRLWPLCGYFRVYNRDRAYEGGGDIRLKISADWMVWTTEEAWNSGQPLVVNRAKAPDRRTDPAWAGFLEAHGIKVLDIYRNQLLPSPEAPAAKPELPVVTLGQNHPTLLAAELVRALGVEPRVGVQVDLARPAGETVAPNLTAPVLWEDGATRVVMEFGELPPEAVQTLRQNGYRVISSGREVEAVIAGVLDGFGLKARDSLVLNAPAGGPKMSLSIKGKLVGRDNDKFLITPTSLPSGLASLLDPNLKIIKYQL